MNLQKRLACMADKVAEAVMSGGSAQEKLAELVSENDLSPNEIRRVVEMANRNSQLGLYKTAENKCFKFELADPTPHIKEAAKQAECSVYADDSAAKMAAAIDEAGGDPFAPIDYPDEERKLSFYDQPLHPDTLRNNFMAENRSMLQSLDRTRRELEAMKTASMQAIIRYESEGRDASSRAIQAAVDLLMSGAIKLPDLYLAVWNSVSGDTSGVNPVDHADALMSVIISGLRKRGVPNHKLGFRFRGDLNEIDSLSEDDLLALAKRAAGVPLDGDVTMQTQKRAQRYLETAHKFQKNDDEGHPFEDAGEWLGVRSSLTDWTVPDSYMDEKNVGNTPGGKIKAINGDSEFIIGIRDLMGCRDRLLKSHNADEYIGLKLKQIEGMMRKLEDSQKVAEAEYDEMLLEHEQAKDAVAQLLPAAAGLASKLAPAAGKVVGALSHPATSNAVGAASTAAGVLPYVAKTKDMKAQENMNKSQGPGSV